MTSPTSSMSDGRCRTRLILVVLFWLLLAALPVWPGFRGGYVQAAIPPAMLYYAAVTTAQVPLVGHLQIAACLVAHLLVALVAGVLVSRAQVREPSWLSAVFTIVLVTLVLSSGGMVGTFGWPFSDDETVYYDVHDLVGTSPSGSARFESTDALAEYLRRQATARGSWWGPSLILNAGNNQLLAHGYPAGHYRLRKELAALHVQ